MSNKKFPKNFLWGAATSAYQVEGGIAQNDWAQSNRLQPAGEAANHYHFYKLDFAIARELFHNAHRLSLEWSRIEPEKGKWNAKALEHYHRVLSELTKLGMKRFVTLHHFTNPDWVAKKGGWINPETVNDFKDFTAKVCESLGQDIDFWITINEPNVYAAVSFMDGQWPPFERSVHSGYKVYRNMLHAHNEAYDIIHSYYPNANVGFAQNIAFNEPKLKGNVLDILATKAANWFSNGFAYNKTKNDFLGLNHYFHNKISFSPASFVKLAKQEGNLTDMGWQIYPKAIYESLKSVRKYGLPIYITENGIADRADEKRGEYIQNYLSETKKAIDEGVDVRGYLHWSLLDNYEWPKGPEETGFDMRFGLVEVNFETQKRTIRSSAKKFAKICEKNSLD